jgi:hypothetical protein
MNIIISLILIQILLHYRSLSSFTRQSDVQYSNMQSIVTIIRKTSYMSADPGYDDHKL